MDTQPTGSGSLGSYFNPSGYQNACKDFKDLKGWQKGVTVTATIAFTIFTLPLLGIGGLVTFKFLTEKYVTPLNFEKGGPVVETAKKVVEEVFSQRVSLVTENTTPAEINLIKENLKLLFNHQGMEAIWAKIDEKGKQNPKDSSVKCLLRALEDVQNTKKPSDIFNLLQKFPVYFREEVVMNPGKTFHKLGKTDIGILIRSAANEEFKKQIKSLIDCPEMNDMWKQAYKETSDSPQDKGALGYRVMILLKKVLESGEPENLFKQLEASPHMLQNVIRDSEIKELNELQKDNKNTLKSIFSDGRTKQLEELGIEKRAELAMTDVLPKGEIKLSPALYAEGPNKLVNIEPDVITDSSKHAIGHKQQKGSEVAYLLQGKKNYDNKVNFYGCPDYISVQELAPGLSLDVLVDSAENDKLAHQGAKKVTEDFTESMRKQIWNHKGDLTASDLAKFAATASVDAHNQHSNRCNTDDNKEGYKCCMVFALSFTDVENNKYVIGASFGDTDATYIGPDGHVESLTPVKHHHSITDPQNTIGYDHLVEMEHFMTPFFKKLEPGCTVQLRSDGIMDSLSPMGKSPNEVFEELKLAGIIKKDEQAQKVFVDGKEFSFEEMGELGLKRADRNFWEKDNGTSDRKFLQALFSAHIAYKHTQITGKMGQDHDPLEAVTKQQKWFSNGPQKSLDNERRELMKREKNITPEGREQLDSDWRQLAGKIKEVRPGASEIPKEMDKIKDFCCEQFKVDDVSVISRKFE